MKKKKAGKFLKEVLGTSLYILVLLIITLLVITFIGQRTEVVGSSMEPMLRDKDQLIVDKITYQRREPERFEIIVFPYQYEEDTFYIKRIIGMPGERVRIDREGRIYINGEIMRESYGREVIADPGLAAKEITLGGDEYFVMGDNRNDSADSRFASVGNIKRSDIVGRAFIRIYPLDRIGILKHK